MERDELTAICDAIEQEEEMTFYKKNIVGYIGGFVVKDLQKSPSCSTCISACVQHNHEADYLNLIHVKDNGGLRAPSEDLFKFLKKCESFFVAYTSGRPGNDLKISRARFVKDLLSRKIQHELLDMNLFSSLLNHDIETAYETQDLHTTQLTKEIIDCYLRITFFRYGQHYTSIKIKKSKHGTRQQSNKLVINNLAINKSSCFIHSPPSSLWLSGF